MLWQYINKYFNEIKNYKNIKAYITLNNKSLENFNTEVLVHCQQGWTLYGRPQIIYDSYGNGKEIYQTLVKY